MTDNVDLDPSSTGSGVGSSFFQRERLSADVPHGQQCSSRCYTQIRKRILIDHQGTAAQKGLELGKDGEFMDSQDRMTLATASGIIVSFCDDAQASPWALTVDSSN